MTFRTGMIITFLLLCWCVGVAAAEAYDFGATVFVAVGYTLGLIASTIGKWR